MVGLALAAKGYPKLRLHWIVETWDGIAEWACSIFDPSAEDTEELRESLFRTPEEKIFQGNGYRDARDTIVYTGMLPKKDEKFVSAYSIMVPKGHKLGEEAMREINDVWGITP
jgi:hypothetical protein